MKRMLLAAVFAGSLAAGTCAVAQQSTYQDSQSAPSSQSANNSDSTSNSMKDCMARQKATNSGLTHTQMQTTCKNEMKADKTRKSGNDLATGTQSGDKPPQQ
jgi:hypothetical protein